jgi:hypothetical protein
MGQSIKIGSTASNNLIFDGHTFSTIGESITRNITGVNFQIKWIGVGSQIFEITRLDGESWAEFEVAVYVPC